MAITRAYRVEYLPHNVVIDRAGRIHAVLGPGQKALDRAVIEALSR